VTKVLLTGGLFIMSDLNSTWKGITSTKGNLRYEPHGSYLSVIFSGGVIQFAQKQVNRKKGDS